MITLLVVIGSFSFYGRNINFYLIKMEIKVDLSIFAPCFVHDMHHVLLLYRHQWNMRNTNYLYVPYAISAIAQ